MATCKVEGCSLAAFKTGLCSRHYDRKRRRGDPNAAPLVAQHGAPQAFLENALTYTGHDCLIWPYARKAKGYAIMKRSAGQSSLVSRRVCEAVHGPAARSDMLAAHNCGNGHLGCVAPSHLRWADADGNREDMLAHGTRMAGEKVPTSRLTTADAVTILASPRDEKDRLAARYGVSEATIRDIWAGRTWKILDSERQAFGATNEQ